MPVFDTIAPVKTIFGNNFPVKLIYIYLHAFRLYRKTLGSTEVVTVWDWSAEWSHDPRASSQLLLTTPPAGSPQHLYITLTSRDYGHVIRLDVTNDSVSTNQTLRLERGVSFSNLVFNQG